MEFGNLIFVGKLRDALAASMEELGASEWFILLALSYQLVYPSSQLTCCCGCCLDIAPRSQLLKRALFSVQIDMASWLPLTTLNKPRYLLTNALSLSRTYLSHLYIQLSAWLKIDVLAKSKVKGQSKTHFVNLEDVFVLHSLVPGLTYFFVLVAAFACGGLSRHYQWSCASLLPIFTQSFLHQLKPTTRGPEICTRCPFSVVIRVFSWTPVR